MNLASRLATPLAPGEPIVANGAGFGVGAQILLDGLPLPVMSSTDTSILAIVPETAKLADAAKLQVSNGSSLSNAMVVPTAPAAPAIYSLDGSGADLAECARARPGLVLRLKQSCGKPQLPRLQHNVSLCAITPIFLLRPVRPSRYS